MRTVQCWAKGRSAATSETSKKGSDHHFILVERNFRPKVFTARDAQIGAKEMFSYTLKYFIEKIFNI